MLRQISFFEGATDEQPSLSLSRLMIRLPPPFAVSFFANISLLPFLFLLAAIRRFSVYAITTHHFSPRFMPLPSHVLLRCFALMPRYDTFFDTTFDATIAADAAMPLYVLPRH